MDRGERIIVAGSEEERGVEGEVEGEGEGEAEGEVEVEVERLAEMDTMKCQWE